MREFLVSLGIGALVRLSNFALAVDAWCFDRAYGMGGVLINLRRRVPSQIRKRR